MLYYYPLSALINALASTVVCIVAIRKNFRSELNRTFSFFSFSVAFWSYCYFFWQISTDYESALFWSRALMAGAIFIPSTFLHFSLTVVDRRAKYLKVIRFWYLVSLAFLISDFTPYFISDVKQRLEFRFWPSPGFFYAPFLLMFAGLTIYAHILMFKRYRMLSGVERNRIKYVFLGTAIGFLGGSTNYLLWYDIPVPPVGNALVAVYVAMIAYATIRYRLMDITLFTIRGLTLTIVYFLVLGIPFWVGLKFLGRGLWILPVSMMAFFASAGPFIYNYIRNRAEEVILRDQRRYQHTLLQVSKSMSLVKELDKLLRLIVHVVTKTIGIKNAAIFLLDKESNKYALNVTRYKNQSLQDCIFETEDPVVKYLVLYKTALVFEEVQSKSKHDSRGAPVDLNNIQERMKSLNIAVIVPSFVQDLLIGFLALGPKSDDQMYTQDDLNVFGVLANQSALAIENAVFYQEQGKTLAEKFHEHKVWSIGKMGAGVGHQINNRFQTLMGAAEKALNIYLADLKAILPAGTEISNAVTPLEESISEVIQEAKRGSEIAVTLTHFSRGSTDMKPVSLEEGIKGALNLLSCKFPTAELNLTQELPIVTPMIIGNLGLLQDVFMNFLDNAHDAQTRKKSEIQQGILQATGSYSPKTNIKARVNESHCEVDIEDNGIGMTEEQLSQMFIPFFTTKATTEKGTGLGMHIIKQMIDTMKGTIKIYSKYGESTKITITLPLAKE